MFLLSVERSGTESRTGDTVDTILCFIIEKKNNNKCPLFTLGKGLQQGASGAKQQIFQTEQVKNPNWNAH